MRELGLEHFISQHKLEVEREKTREKEKKVWRERGLKRVKNLGAKVRPRLGFLELEVRGLVFKHNHFLPISHQCLFDKWLFG